MADLIDEVQLVNQPLFDNRTNSIYGYSSIDHANDRPGDEF